MKSLKLLLYIIICFAYALWRGKAVKVSQEVKTVCVIQRAKLGDMVCTTPMFGAIKKQYPNAKLWVVGDGLNKELLAGHPSVDGYIVWERSENPIHAELQKHTFDAVFVTTPGSAALISSLLAGVPLIVAPKIVGGWSPYETRSYKLLSKLVVTVPHAMHAYAARQYLLLLEPLGVNANDATKVLTYSEVANTKALQIQSAYQKPLVGISPAAGNKIKQWPPERFATVADYVAKKYGATVLVFGGQRDVVEVEQMLGNVTEKERVVSLVKQLSIDELKAVISKLDLFISADTGAIYIAEAFGIATIDIVGPVDEKEQPPIGERHIVLVPKREKPELFVMNARSYNEQEAKRQASYTSTQEVMDATDSLLKHYA